MRDVGSIPGLRRCPGREHGNPLQSSCLENPMDRGASGLQFLGSQSQTRLKQVSTHSGFSSVAQLCPTLVTPWIAALQAFLSFTISLSLLQLMSIESVMPSNYLILYCPLLLPSSIFPASGSFQMSQFSSGGQSIGVSASASVLPMSIQD